MRNWQKILEFNCQCPQFRKKFFFLNYNNNKILFSFSIVEYSHVIVYKLKKLFFIKFKKKKKKKVNALTETQHRDTSTS